MASPDFGEDRRKHLDFIQAAIGRMAAASSVAKGWCLTLATAAFGYALTKDSESVALVGVCAVVLFAYLDVRYLREERKFRALYDDARKGRVDTYDMSTRGYSKAKGCRTLGVAWSWSVAGFYAPILVGGVAVLIAAC